MFLKLLFIYILILPSIVHSLCYSNLSKTWICDDSYKSNITKSFRVDYHSTLLNEQFENLYLKNHDLSIFIIDQYPSTLYLFNASNNYFQTIIITSKQRYRSNLRQLILESNNIRQFNSDTITLPESLEIISLANNLLEILDARLFSHLKKLIKIDLRNNKLKRILPELLSSINIDLNNNPLDCQCTPEFYRTKCEKSTNLNQSTNERNDCMAPYYDDQQSNKYSVTYLRFSTFTLFCPIKSNPPPIIIWTTPFGILTSHSSSNVDLLLSANDKPIYKKLITLAGPFSARTRHIVHAVSPNHLSVTQARGSLEHRISCTGINMLGSYKYEFDFIVETKAEKHAVRLMLYTIGFGLSVSLIGVLMCIILKRTYYYPLDHMKTPPLYPTMTPNSASRTPPNFELNQWFSSAAANITGTLEQVRDKLRQSVQQAGGTIRQAAESSAAYLQSFRETSQHRLNLIRVQTLSSLRTSGHLMRAGMNMLTTQVNSLRDYCGLTSGHYVPTNNLIQQQLYNLQHSRPSVVYVNYNQLSTIAEEGESMIESTPVINIPNRSPYAGFIASTRVVDGFNIGQLDKADNSAVGILNNATSNETNTTDDENILARGLMIGGIGTFHDHYHNEHMNESE